MKEIIENLKAVSKKYNEGDPHLSLSLELIEQCLTKLSNSSIYEKYGSFNGQVKVDYFSFSFNSEFSRPIRDDLLINDFSSFSEIFNNLLSRLHQNCLLSEKEEKDITKIIYTSMMSFAACIDLWKRGSRKTPGTFFEVFMAALLKEFFPQNSFTKHIPLSDILEEESKVSLSTDLVIASPESEKIAVVPLKITTRERIVQPFAHQRILDSAFGSGRYKSFLACISETQMDHNSRTVKQVCVPGTVKLYKKYLGDIEGIYYCDIPERYNEQDLQKIISVKEIGCIFNDLKYFFNLDE